MRIPEALFVHERMEALIACLNSPLPSPEADCSGSEEMMGAGKGG